MVHRAAVLLRARSDARVGLVGDHELMHQRLVEVAREHLVGRLHGAGGTLTADHLEFHRFNPSPERRLWPAARAASPGRPALPAAPRAWARLEPRAWAPAP